VHYLGAVYLSRVAAPHAAERAEGSVQQRTVRRSWLHALKPKQYDFRCLKRPPPKVATRVSVGPKAAAGVGP
jgi:hypothetical protein